MIQEKLYKALDTIALNNSQGIVSDDLLIKACENYKQKIGFEEDLDYHLIVSKSLFDYLNDVPQDEELIKAIVPGQTKMVDGIMYIYSKTKAGSKTDYNWHVAKDTKVGRNADVDNSSVFPKQKYVNEQFPSDVKNLKFVKTLGGSTGAVLVEDDKGRQFVKKQGDKDKAKFVENEYKANQLYQLLGARVPDYELYKDGDTSVLLSKFIPGLQAVNKYSDQQNRKKLGEFFIADVLLANWDIYCNDNCNLDLTGRVLRVDNGGTLAYRAQGGSKTFDGDVLKTYHDMIQHNSGVFNEIEPNELLKQIEDIRKRKDSLLDFMKQSSYDTELIKAMKERIDNLSQIEQEVKLTLIDPDDQQILPRDILPEDEMYREFTEEEIQEIWKDADGDDVSKFDKKGQLGWKLLHTIVEKRGFDARPRVLDDKEYWDFIAKSKNRQLLRGVRNSPENPPKYTAEFSINQFKFTDDFFVGNEGIYGAGLYAHVNDADLNGGKADCQSNSYKNSDAYDHARSYADGKNKNIMLMGLEDDFKFVQYEDLKKELQELAENSVDKNLVNKIKKEIDDLSTEISATESKIDNYSKSIRNKVYQEMNYDEQATEKFLDLQLTTNWGKFNANGEREFPTFDEIVKTEYVACIESNGGKAVERKGEIVFSLPNAREKFTIQKFIWDDPRSIRQAYSVAPFYHLTASRFEDWLMTNHVNPAREKAEEAVRTDGQKELSDLTSKIEDLKSKTRVKKKEYDDAMTPDVKNNIYQAAISDFGEKSLGVIAAIRGYDGIYVPKGNDSSNGFAVILNRSKVVVKK